MTRWVTFDCYGTLIDWNAGIGDTLVRVFGVEEPEPAAPEEDAEAGELSTAGEAAAPASKEREELLERYHLLERELEQDGTRSYREVLTEALRRMGAPAGEEGALAASLPDWQPFPEVPDALAEISARGWRMAILSNSDRDFIDASIAQLGVRFDEVVLASEVRAYKPSLMLWTEFYTRTLADKRRHVHVAASLYHDIAPAVRLRLPNIWINRLDEHPGPSPTIMLADCSELPDALDSIIPE